MTVQPAVIVIINGCNFENILSSNIFHVYSAMLQPLPPTFTLHMTGDSRHFIRKHFMIYSKAITALRQNIAQSQVVLIAWKLSPEIHLTLKIKVWQEH